MPEGATVVFSAHGVSPTVHDEAKAREPEDHRRHLPAGDQGPPRGEAVRRRRLRHPPDRARRSRGGRGHLGRGARAHPARAGSGRRRRHRGPRPVQGRLALADDAVGRRDARDGRRDPPALPRAARPAQRRHLLRHAEPPARGQGDRPRRRPGDRGRLGELLQLRTAGRGRARGRRQGRPPRRRRRARSTTRGSRASTTVSVTSGASVPEALVDGVLAYLTERGYPDAEAVHSAEESLIFALPPELRRVCGRPGERLPAPGTLASSRGLARPPRRRSFADRCAVATRRTGRAGSSRPRCRRGDHLGGHQRHVPRRAPRGSGAAGAPTW